jgi:hypothetical protein
LAGSKEERKRRRLKLCAEVVKYIFIDVAIAITLPPLVTIPLKLQQYGAGPHPGSTGLVGLPDILISFAILAWAAFRNVLDAKYLDESVKVIFIVFAVVLGLANIILALWGQRVTLASFWGVNNYLFFFSWAVIAFSLALSGGIAIGRGMKDA